jgi:hypothetical protein
MAKIYRDDEGKIMAYTGENFEVLYVKFDERISRIESNVMDIKNGLFEERQKSEKLTERFSSMCQSLHELMENLGGVIKKNNDLAQTCVELNIDSVKIKTGVIFIKWLIASAGVIGTVYFAVLEFFHKNIK